MSKDAITRISGLAFRALAKRMGGVVAGLALGVGLVACGSSASGSQTIQDKANGFSLTTPAGWTRYTVNPKTLAHIASELKSNPKLAGIAAEIQGPTGHLFKLLMLDPNGHRGASVAVIPGGPALTSGSLSLIEQKFVSELQQFGDKVTPSPVGPINGHPAFHFAVISNVKIHGQSLPPQTQYYFLVGRSLYNLDVNGTSQSQTDQISGSFKIAAPAG